MWVRRVMRLLVFASVLAALGMLGVGSASAGETFTLDKEFCTAHADVGSKISFGSWDSSTKICTGVGAVIEDGDVLVVPNGTTLMVDGNFTVWPGRVVNRGVIAVGSALGVFGESSVENYGSVTVEMIQFSFFSLGNEHGCCGSFDNHGSFAVSEMFGNWHETFVNECGSEFSSPKVPAYPPIEEPCPWPLAMVDTTSGIWHLRVSGAIDSFYFGNPGDAPFMGDWDCDGTDTPGLYRQSDGFVYLRNSNTQGVADVAFFFGNPGDVPLGGDFNSDGCDSVSIYRPSQQMFYVINRLGTTGEGLGGADYSFVFGNPGDSPFVGDFNGDDQDSIGLHRGSTGLVYYRNTLTSGVADGQFIFGNSSDDLFVNDWTKTGVDTPAAFRSTTGRHYLRFDNSSGPADAVVEWGNAAWTPVAIHP